MSKKKIKCKPFVQSSWGCQEQRRCKQREEQSQPSRVQGLSSPDYWLMKAHFNIINLWETVKRMWNLPQIQSRHHNFVLPIQKSQFLLASHQAAVKKRWKTFKTESLWFFSEFRSHFRLHIQWNPFPTQQHQDHQKGGRTSCLWKFFLPKYSQLLLFKTWATKCWGNQWHWSASLDPPYQTCSQTTRPGCRRDWMFFVFFFRYLGFYLHSVGSLSHALKAALM